MAQIEFKSRVRLEKIVLQNFKGIKNGEIEFNCLKSPIEKETCADILGIYGQNGSGKTTLLEALHIAKLAMMGRKIPVDKFRNIISKDSDKARMSLTFQVKNEDDTFYHVEYAFSLGLIMLSEKTNLDDIYKILKRNKVAEAGALAALTPLAALAPLTPLLALPVAGVAGILVNELLKASKTRKDTFSTEMKDSKLVIFDEVLNLSGNFNGTTVRFGPIFDASSKEEVFLPKVRQKSFFPKKTSAALKELQKYKDKALLSSRSLIFGNELSQLILEHGVDGITEYAEVIFNLKAYAIQKLRVLDSRILGASNDDVIPLYTANRGVGIKRSDSTTYLDNDGLKTLQCALDGLNVVLKQLIPGLELEAVRQIDVDLEDSGKRNKPGTKVTVYSVRDGIRIPLAEESTGILRIISVLGLYAYAFVNEGVTVAIDEIDSGVYEYLLGELLLIFEEYGCGQLIFTCHNLRPMEVLDKKFIYFTTTNSENRYLKPKNIRNENNLRDVYLREIVMGGQDENLYSTAKHGKIAAALQKAGEIIGQE